MTAGERSVVVAQVEPEVLRRGPLTPSPLQADRLGRELHGGEGDGRHHRRGGGTTRVGSQLGTGHRAGRRD